MQGEPVRMQGVDVRVLSTSSPASVAPVQAKAYPGEIISNGNSSTFNSVSGDPRDLPMNNEGYLLNPSGQEVRFEIPNNPNDPGVCATPTPFVVQDDNQRAMANCPVTVPCDNAVNRDANIPTAVDPIKYFKLNWTVLLDAAGASTNIDQTRVDALMAEVNADFAPFRIEFCADPATFVVDPTFYDLNVGAEDGPMKNTYAVTPADVINIYVAGNLTNPAAGGYARFPYDPFGGLNIRGGVVLARGNMFVGTHTLAHELGHTFGLFHTFHGVDEVTPCTNCYEGRDLPSGASSGADTEGDWCSDTNPHPTNANICGDNGADGCAPNLPWLNSPVNNHMSYSFCTTQFTPQQGGRMHCMIDTYLQNWVNFGGATCGALPPVADFSGNPTLWQAPMNVTFTDLSVPATTITNWAWNFDVAGIGGVTPATFNGQVPPAVEYTICDTSYTVSLTVTNANGSDTETKVNYIRANCPAGECDTLLMQWETPTPTVSIFGLGPGDNLTGIPAPTLSGGPGVNPIGFYEQYITPTPGTTTVGAARIALGALNDPDSNTVVQVVIYNCDATGFPIGAPLTGLPGINPGADLGTPGGSFYLESWVPFTKTVIDSPSFLVGVEIFPGDATDQLIVMSSDDTQGQAAGLNHTSTNGFGYVNYLAFVGIDFDLGLVPMLGPWQAETFITGLAGLFLCDTTILQVIDTVQFQECMTNMTVTSFFGGTISDTIATTLDTLLLFYTSPGPDTITFETVNECGRTDSVTFTLNYPFDTTPNPEFIVSPANPVCAGTAITFTATPATGADYTWDFGDGTVASSAATNTTTHTYTNPGLYYVNLTLTDPSGCSGEELKLDLIEIIDCSVNAPLANFQLNPDTVCIGDTVFFSDFSVATPDPPTDWLWAFDDGNFSIVQNPNHSYTSSGTYTVMFVSRNSGGADTIFQDVVVVPDPCLLPAGIVLRASPLDDAVVLDWEVPQFLDGGHYEIERSHDGQTFVPIGELQSDFRNHERLYSFVDATALPEIELYYRVIEVEANGQSSRSNVVQVRLASSEDAWLRVYPNPISPGAEINVDALLTQDGDLEVELMDVMGRILMQQNSRQPAGLGRIQMSTEQLAAGTYLLRVQSERGARVVRISVR